MSDGDSAQANWDACICAIWYRLSLAREKTHTAEQRATLVRAIVIPKITYVACHPWPSKAVIARLHGIVMDFEWGSRDDQRSRAWVPKYQVALTVQHGGIGTPCVRSELACLAAVAVGRWAASSTLDGLRTGDLLWGSGQPLYITPCWSPSPRPLHTLLSLFETGAKAVARTLAAHTTCSDASNVRSCARRLASSATVFISDETGSVTIHGRQMIDDECRSTMRRARASDGEFDARWLRHASLHITSWLLDQHGLPCNARRASFARSGLVLAEVIEWEWLALGVVRFSPVGSSTIESRAAIRLFERFCLALVYNYPELLQRPAEPGTLLAYEPAAHTHHDWRLSDSSEQLLHYDAGMHCSTTTTESMHACEMAATSLLRQRVLLKPHPALTRLVSIRSGRRRWQLRRTALMKVITTEARAEGEKLRDKATNHPSHAIVSLGTDTLSWTDIRTIHSLMPIADTLPAQEQ